MLASITDSLKPYHCCAGFICFLLSCLVLRSVISRRRRNPRALPHPPGPKGLPLIHNLFDVPIHHPWLVYDEWHKVYGDMIYFEVLGKQFLVLGSLRRTTDLLEKRSSICSDRPRLVMLNELMGWGWNFAFICYGPLWRRHRRTFHEFFHPNVVSKYEAIQAREGVNLIRRLMDTPDGFVEHIRHTSQAAAMDVMYNIKVEETGDPYLERAGELTDRMVEAGVPGRFLVDLIPILKYVPNWFPGAGFKNWAARQARLNRQVVELPFEEVERKLQCGKFDDTSSMAASLLKRLPQDNVARREDDRAIAQEVVAAALVAGADTMFSSVQTFFLAMAMYPGVQRKAQSDIDKVTGSKRLPDFSDRESLPYVNAIVKETLRWWQVSPLGLWHTSVEDMEYDGYFIPKGTLLIGNSWSIMHDVDHYSDPREFRPERYLKDGQWDPEVRLPDAAAFGFGRRTCPGKHYALASLYSTVVSVLAVHDITPATDAQGHPVKLEAKFTSGVLSYPAPFCCSIKPRSDAARGLIVELSERQKSK